MMATVPANSGVFKRRASVVVLPLPRNPVSTVTGRMRFALAALIDWASFEIRGQSLGVRNFVGRDLEQVTVEHDQIRGLADLDRAGDVSEPERPRAVDGVDLEGRSDVECMFG